MRIDLERGFLDGGGFGNFHRFFWQKGVGLRELVRQETLIQDCSPFKLQKPCISGDSLVSGVAIKMTSESGSGQTKTVNYVITGASTNPIDIDDARRRFNQLLRDSNLTGVQPVDAPPPPNNDAQGQELPDSGQRGWTNMIPDSQ